MNQRALSNRFDLNAMRWLANSIVLVEDSAYIEKEEDILQVDAVDVEKGVSVGYAACYLGRADSMRMRGRISLSYLANCLDDICYIEDGKYAFLDRSDDDMLVVERAGGLVTEFPLLVTDCDFSAYEKSPFERLGAPNAVEVARFTCSAPQLMYMISPEDDNDHQDMLTFWLSGHTLEVQTSKEEDECRSIVVSRWPIVNNVDDLIGLSAGDPDVMGEVLSRMLMGCQWSRVSIYTEDDVTGGLMEVQVPRHNAELSIIFKME